MSLTDRDMENAARVHDLCNAQNHAHAVSIPLSLAAFLANAVAEGEEILLRTPDGTISRVKMAELEGAA
jgi:hypothetical protein